MENRNTWVSTNALFALIGDLKGQNLPGNGSQKAAQLLYMKQTFGRKFRYVGKANPNKLKNCNFEHFPELPATTWHCQIVGGNFFVIIVLF